MFREIFKKNTSKEKDVLSDDQLITPIDINNGKEIEMDDEQDSNKMPQNNQTINPVDLETGEEINETESNGFENKRAA